MIYLKLKNRKSRKNNKYSFFNKRKMIKKNIKKILSDNKIDLLQIKTTARASEIKPQTYYKITELYENN